MEALKSRWAILFPLKAPFHSETHYLSLSRLYCNWWRYKQTTSQRVFAVPVEGRSFKWTLGVWRSTVSLMSLRLARCCWWWPLSKLELNDGSQTPVARGHRSNVGILGKPRQACLEIFPGFEHLVDIILVTYIFIEKLRKDRERDGRNAHI